MNYTNTCKSDPILVIRDLKNASSVKGGKKFDRIIVSIPENIELTCSAYLEFVDLTKVTRFVSFSEEGDFAMGDKRAERTSRNAVDGLKLCLAGGRKGVLGNVQGGQDVESRKWCLREMIKSEADGIYFGGLGVEDHGLALRQLLKECCGGLPEYRKSKVLSGMGRPLDIIYASALGFNSFETYFPFYLAGEGRALNFTFSSIHSVEQSDFFSFQDNEYQEETLDLVDPIHRFSNEPLLHNCKCKTCQHHTRGYIHHLISMKELTAATLLSVHNTWIYQELQNFLLTHQQNNTLDEAYSAFVVNCCVRIV